MSLNFDGKRRVVKKIDERFVVTAPEDKIRYASRQTGKGGSDAARAAAQSAQ